MEDFDNVLWGFIFSVIGISFGWILNQFSQWFRTRQEDKKNLKLVLFNLLETYFLFIRSDFDKYIQKINTKMLEIIPEEEQNKETNDLIQSVYSIIINNHLKPELIEEFKIIETNYQSSINVLATIDPLTAYYLSGRSSITLAFENIQNAFEDIKSDHPEEETEIQNGLNKVIALLKPNLFKESLNDLEHDIKKMAFKINPYVWYKSKRAIKKLKVKSNQILDVEIDEIFKQLSPLFGE